MEGKCEHPRHFRHENFEKIREEIRRRRTVDGASGAIESNRPSTSK